MSLLFRLICIVLGMAAIVVAVLISSVALGVSGGMLFAWTLGYGWGEANAYYEWITALWRQP
jgi:hypothetical protein